MLSVHNKRVKGVMFALCVSGFAGLASTGCQEPEYRQQWDESYDISAPFRAKDGAMVYIHRSFGQIIRVQPAKINGKVEILHDRIRIDGDLQQGLLNGDGTALFVMDGDKKLHRVDLSNPDEMSVDSVDLASAYDRMVLDPEEEFLLMSFNDSSQSSAKIIVRNLNEVAIVDLRAAEMDARFVTLSNRALDFEFAPSFELGGESRRLVAALSNSEVTIVDLLAEDDLNALREVPLTLSEAEAIKRPEQAVFDVTPDESLPDTINLYVKTTQGTDITQISVQPSVRQDSAYTFDISVNQLAAGASPGKIAVLELPGRGTRLLALNRATPEFTLVDVASGESASFTLPMTKAATEFLTYTASRQAGEDATEEIRILAYSQDSPVVSVIRPETISIGGDQPTLGRSVEAIRLERNPSSIDYDAEAAANRAVVFHGGYSGGFTILDLEANRDLPIDGYSLNDVLFDGLYAYGTLASSNLVAFELDTGHPTAFDLPYQAQSLTLDVSEGVLLLDAGEPEGSFIALDAEEPTPENAQVHQAIFLEGALNFFDK